MVDNDSVVAVADAAVSELGGLHIWANVAGIYPVYSTLDMTREEWQKIIDVNLGGTFFGAREAARRMIAAGNPGVIINFESTTVHKIPSPGLAHYIASKGGVESLTRALAVEFSPNGIRVFAIAPTMVRTPGMEVQKPELTEAFGNVGDPWVIYGSGLPLGRIGVPDDVARVVLFCASDLSLMMTGQMLAVDSGDLLI